MGSVMIDCPDTGREVYTGIEMDETSFGRLPDVPTRTLCPICANEHVWTKAQAWLADPRTLLRQVA